MERGTTKLMLGSPRRFGNDVVALSPTSMHLLETPSTFPEPQAHDLRRNTDDCRDIVKGRTSLVMKCRESGASLQKRPWK